MNHVTRENLMDWVHSTGLRMKHLCNPSAHPYDDPRRTVGYPAKLAACRTAWARLRDGWDMDGVLRHLGNALNGPDGNGLSLIQHALNGDFAKDAAWFKNPPKGHHWVTYGGDFYSVDTGDDLNLPKVHRVANRYLPKERQVVDGAKALATMLPNPCTRITAPAQFG